MSGKSPQATGAAAEDARGPRIASYARIDSQTAAFSRETGIACPRGCGECCTSIDFAVSRPEADLVAEYLLGHEELLARFLAQPISAEKGQCPLYDPQNADAHCTVYPARPLLCRTFAFAQHRDKTGEPRYAPCHVFRQVSSLAERVDHVPPFARSEPALPILPDESLAIWALDPTGDVLPMGPAVRRAVESALLKRSLESA